MPGLSGYVGIDLIRNNNTFFVIDINPRFTTSYAGISKSLGINIVSDIATVVSMKNKTESTCSLWVLRVSSPIITVVSLLNKLESMGSEK